MRRLLVPLLVVSLLTNAAVAVIHHYGGLRSLELRIGLAGLPQKDYPAEARKRFEALPRGPHDVVVLGDSLVAKAPLADLMSIVKPRGIEGQTVADVRRWLARALTPPPARIVLLAGTNNVLRGDTPQSFATQYAALLDDIKARAPHAAVTVLTIPPLTGHVAARVPSFNAALRRVARARRDRIGDLFTPLADTTGALPKRYTVDGIHLSAAAYGRVAGVFAAARK